MTKFIITAVMAMLAMASRAQVSEVAESKYFSKIEVQSGIEMIYTQNEVFSIKKEASNMTDLKNLTTEINGKTLKIYYSQKRKNTTDGKALKVYVTANNVVSFNANSNAKIEITNTIYAKEIKVEVASGASFKGVIAKNEKTTFKARSGGTIVGQVETDYLLGDFQNGATASLSGKAKKSVINTSSGAFCTAKNLDSGDVSITAKGFSSVSIHAHDKIAVITDENSSVSYFGKPNTINLAQNSFLIKKKSKNNPVLIAME